MSTLWVELTLPGPGPSAIFILGGTCRLSNTSDHSVWIRYPYKLHNIIYEVLLLKVGKTCFATVTARAFENAATIIERSGHHF